MTDNQNWAVLPVKPFGEAKSRLSEVLAAADRRALARSLMLHSLQALLASEFVDRVLVISSDPEALTLASQHRADTLPETHTGLNRALVQARRHAVNDGANSLLVLASDLPLVAPSDIDALFRARAAAVVIAPDRRCVGTNALLLSPPEAIEFAFGDNSFQGHFDLALAAGLVATDLSLPGLAFDVDLAEDWQDLLSLGWNLDDATYLRQRV
jgi:2-phospho-L-lactate guanylyltransferase